MKIQDIFFLIIFGFILFKRDPKWAASLGILSLVLAIPFFTLWIFFTAERLTWYAAGFFLLSAILYLFKNKSFTS